MKRQRVESKGQRAGFPSNKRGLRGVLFSPITRYSLLVTFFLLSTIHCSLVTAAFAAEWSGVDESVVEKYAKDHGREAHEPLINTDQGDLLLFMFLIGGVIGGFAAGYYWRTLMEDRTKNQERRQQTEEKVNGPV